MQTISTGMPKLCVSVLSPSGNTTASSSPDVGARRGEDGVASSGSVYSWKAFTTWEGIKETKYKIGEHSTEIRQSVTNYLNSHKSSSSLTSLFCAVK